MGTKLFDSSDLYENTMFNAFLLCSHDTEQDMWSQASNDTFAALSVDQLTTHNQDFSQDTAHSLKLQS